MGLYKNFLSHLEHFLAEDDVVHVVRVALDFNQNLSGLGALLLVDLAVGQVKLLFVVLDLEVNLHSARIAVALGLENNLAKTRQDLDSLG